MRQFILMLAAFGFSTQLTCSAESTEQPPDRNVLDRWLGTWYSNADIKPSAWVPEGKQQAEVRNVEWILNGRFLQVTYRSDDHETRQILRYEANSKKFQKWIFDTYGGTSFWTGSWDEKSKAMTWKMEFSPLKGTITDRFSNSDKCETSVVLKDGEGKLLLDVLTEHTRVLKK